jgi:hypothetical protein
MRTGVFCLKTAIAADSGKMIRYGRIAKRYDLSHPNARRSQGVGEKFIPDDDSGFALMAKVFSSNLSRDPSVYHIPDDTAREIAEAVEAYRDALAANLDRGNRSMRTSNRKNAARERAERLIRDAANLIRVNRQIDPLAKSRLRIKQRSDRPKRRTCPETPPKLSFVEANVIEGVHVIRFRDPFGKKSSDAKPAGARCMELYYDLVPPDEPIPQRPGERTGGHKLYLRSFTRSPLTIRHPKCDKPMRLVYWGCWVDAAGEQGPFSRTLVTRVDGDHLYLPQSKQERREQTVIITSGHRALPQIIKPITIEGAEVDERRLLTDETAEAA